MKTLCVHPDDRSTDFLKRVYKGKDWDVISSWPGDRKTLAKTMRCYDRIVMMGHGTPGGLLNVNKFYGREEPQPTYVVDDSFVDILAGKKTVSIWCYSDQYARRNKLPGFHTGMIISEVREAEMVLGSAPLDEKRTLDNMNLFADVVNRHIDDSDLLEAQRLMREEYGRDDPVSEFNRKNIIMLNGNGEDL